MEIGGFALGRKKTENIIKLLPAIEKLVDRYTCKRSSKNIDIPFEACRGNIGDLITVVSLKENNYKRGHFDVDIRKCVKMEEGSYRYTSEGVRFTQSLIAVLNETLLGYKSTITQITDRTSEVISMTTAFVIIREINELADPRQNCQGCKSQHPSQKQHMVEGGCLSTDQPTWEETCNKFWQVGKSLIKDEDVQDLAVRAVSRIPEMQKQFIPGLVPMEHTQDSDLKDYVLRKDELKDSPKKTNIMSLFR
ncbi:uncharacterized protein LOC132735421 [Ruditapes philippinarum]|uniref:uncharacterized protein LOC132735421 n=1 Tax=Ruditapes philippinarum TaxID=129788 RepID=UPI00295C01CA|nr:uncharacterized protein LOC132735421 [Ruditapes philippinarum]